MQTRLQVLSDEECHQIHDRSLSVLLNTGVRVDTARGRQVLEECGAFVDSDTHVVRLPRPLVEDALRLAPREFALGARRPGWDLEMNSSDCTLLIDGEALFAIDRQTGRRRPSTRADLIEATLLIDALDEIGVYWRMVEAHATDETLPDKIDYWHNLFASFSKHVQDTITDPAHAPWLLEVMQVVFGDRETIRRKHPLSFLLCPQSPLVIAGPYSDAYLALTGWDIPVAAMPMPIMGATAPASLVSTMVTCNCEVLALLCLIQASAPGTPFIYAPVPVVMDPRTGRYSAGSVENGLLGAAVTQMARYYGLPAEASGFATNAHTPGIQDTYERTLNGALAALSWPDILVGPGLLEGSMVLSFEQLLIDVEVFRMCRRAHEGIASQDDKWIESVAHEVGPGGNFLMDQTTIAGIRSGEWYINSLGVHGTYEDWKTAGRPTLLEQARDEVEHILATHRPLPLDPEMERELERIKSRAQVAISA
jgi:trimethylamine---corrinoid protein Co-methyltransferase